MTSFWSFWGLFILSTTSTSSLWNLLSSYSVLSTICSKHYWYWIFVIINTVWYEDVHEKWCITALRGQWSNWSRLLLQKEIFPRLSSLEETVPVTMFFSLVSSLDWRKVTISCLIYLTVTCSAACKRALHSTLGIIREMNSGLKSTSFTTTLATWWNKSNIRYIKSCSFGL